MKEVTYKDWLRNPTPRMMWVWDDDEENRIKLKVVYVLRDNYVPNKVITIDNDDSDYEFYRHCAEIEEPKKRLMSYQELAWWLRDNNRREYKYVNAITGVYFELAYDEDEADVLVDKIVIRENGGEWKEPLVEIE